MIEKKLEKRVAKLEKVNVVAEDKALDDRTITLKEVYERIIALETRFDITMENDQKTKNTFTKWVVMIVVLEIINLILHLYR